jgi:hypothetical protein
MVIPLYTSEKRIQIPREGCVERNDCDLKEIIFFVEDYEFPIDPSVDENVLMRGTKFMAGIETTNVAALQNYVFVQFIRGCMWNSQQEADGSITTSFSIARTYLGKRTHFVHREWTVDSVDLDPAYSTEEENADRHFAWEWSDPRPTWIPSRQQKLFGEETPTVPFGFVMDSPEPLATFRPANPSEPAVSTLLGRATNRSLEFRMCVYRASDVPVVTDGTPSGLGEPIACYNWRSTHVYDYDRGAFVSPEGIHAECSRPFNETEEHIEELFRSDKPKVSGN